MLAAVFVYSCLLYKMVSFSLNFCGRSFSPYFYPVLSFSYSCRSLLPQLHLQDEVCLQTVNTRQNTVKLEASRSYVRKTARQLLNQLEFCIFHTSPAPPPTPKEQLCYSHDSALLWFAHALSMVGWKYVTPGKADLAGSRKITPSFSSS